uniref:Cytochrome c oxidase subunit 3 n=1 Tax=Polycheles coccifer TaxID=2004537 RepID=A0A3Q8BDY3_9EUCA|nr:cytochrome c oxidase subunit 3 [Polycheles coccifer]
MSSPFNHHPFHLVNMSPWPLTGALSAFLLTTGLIKWFHLFNPDLLFLSLFSVLLTMFQWWRDVTREGTYQGSHTKLVKKGLQWGMILFILSEVLFFFAFFWAFFHSSLSPSVELGILWPPMGISPFNPFQIPLLNTTVLLSSGATITWAHHSLMNSNYPGSLQGLGLSIILGLYFTALQAYEYSEAPFSIADSVYGATFFVTTGFHGLHVLIGTTFLSITWYRLYSWHFSSDHHFGFEAAAWYWHFVDVVWLFLYLLLYWWGN